jgi:hypothetical protein
MFLHFASCLIPKKGQFSVAPTFLDPLASSSQWFYFAVVVSPVGKRPVLVTHCNAGATPMLYLEGEPLLSAVLFN